MEGIIHCPHITIHDLGEEDVVHKKVEHYKDREELETKFKGIKEHVSRNLAGLQEDPLRLVLSIPCHFLSLGTLGEYLEEDLVILLTFLANIADVSDKLRLLKDSLEKK
ncbi:hypothetical protein AVEN_144888-1 [Araneus ventricosus]|uniref:Uncharacterized protein n=1 Tax=Araneus ventricosus TaxID=182803 RepID=A0A4Y2EDY6_ARAVE|nr:hypothetical protein AVEN_144888-1 [Araneus ventricosus]